MCRDIRFSNETTENNYVDLTPIQINGNDIATETSGNTEESLTNIITHEESVGNVVDEGLDLEIIVQREEEYYCNFESRFLKLYIKFFLKLIAIHTNMSDLFIARSYKDIDIILNENTVEDIWDPDTEGNPSFIPENVYDKDPTFTPEDDDEDSSKANINLEKEKLEGIYNFSVINDMEIVAQENKEVPEKGTLGNDIITVSSRKRRRFAEPKNWKSNIIKQKRLALGRHILTETMKRFMPSKKRNRKVDPNFNKEVSRAYTLPNSENENVRVCLKFFCNTFSISKRISNDALKFKSPNGNYHGCAKRKGRQASNATPQARIREVLSFLLKFPKVPSHYCRQRSSRLYLAPDLTIEKMYDLYKEDAGEQAVKNNIFQKIFREHEPPLVIYRPKKDQCSLCNEAQKTKEMNTKKDEDKKAALDNKDYLQ
ncbi:unnamed protein product [Diabrotica balteata]|uniref:Uncharacterized protein n=1 Tax=Diabrotica balteata TaxID=107213 RepID=A0A9N9TCH7_DIABA|nr:unnamed protein product [Diabrotica balteata]